MEEMMLTTAQSRFLASYLPDIMDEKEMDSLSRCEFVERVSGMDFDDGSPATPSYKRIAKTLLSKGMLSELTIHDGHIYLVFSDAGAHALFEIHRKRI